MVDENYIKGFFDGEGSVGLYTAGRRAKQYGYAYNPEISLSNTCLSILIAIKEYLEQKGYHPHIRKKGRSNPKWNTAYVLCVSRWNDILRFIEEIGTEHPAKQAIFNEIKAYSKVARKTKTRLVSNKQLEDLFEGKGN